MQKQPTVVVYIVWHMHEKHILEKHILANVLGAKLAASAARHPSECQYVRFGCVSYVCLNAQALTTSGEPNGGF